MSALTAPGCEIIATCEESIFTTSAAARFAMKSCASGVIVWSWRPTRAQAGIVFHAVAVVGSAVVAPAAGRCAAQRMSDCFCGS